MNLAITFCRQSPGACHSGQRLSQQRSNEQLATWPEHYTWIEPEGLSYFRSRVSLAQRDVEHGLEVTLAHFTTREAQQRALDILQFKLDILWTMLDSIEKAFPS